MLRSNYEVSRYRRSKVGFPPPLRTSEHWLFCDRLLGMTFEVLFLSAAWRDVYVSTGLRLKIKEKRNKVLLHFAL